MSEVRVNNIVDYGGKGAPTFDNGAVISGVSSLGNQAKIGSNVTITSGGINVSGVTTAATLSGNLTGDVNTGFVTATSAVIGSGVTINAGGLNITGVVTATTFEGSGASMTGVAMTITPLAYNPDVNDGIVDPTTGIGITFDHRILAGSGNVTLSIATNAGAAGTTVENFGVGSSVTIAGRKAIITPTSELDPGETYHLSYPSGAFTNTGGDVSYVGTAYTFGTKSYTYSMFVWGGNDWGVLGNNTNGDASRLSSPTQIPGSWNKASRGGPGEPWASAQKSDGTLWGWGKNEFGQVGSNNNQVYSSPIQIPGTTWATVVRGKWTQTATKTDGTLWSWGYGTYGRLGHNNQVSYSSPTQIGGGTDWATTDGKITTANITSGAIKTDGTLWVWGYNAYGQLGQNARTDRSSPVQVPGTTWRTISAAYGFMATKTDGTLWMWGRNDYGSLGHNNRTHYSSPVQIPGTTWSEGHFYMRQNALAVKTDGTFWTWGRNEWGQLGHNNATSYSSPVQVPGTTWSTKNYHLSGDNQDKQSFAIKTDGTFWGWGLNTFGSLGLNQSHHPTGTCSSPTQIPGTTWHRIGNYGQGAHAIKRV